MDLATFWFVMVAVLWAGYLALDGFDFGVAMLMRLLARDEAERRVLLNTVGPVWDGNEVWLVTAVGATLAAFPEWYATAWSGSYLLFLVLLLALIGRGLALEYRAKGDSEQWRRRCDRVLVVGSALAAFTSGVVLAGFAGGSRPLGGVVTLLLSLLHGAHYTVLKTVGDMRVRARRLAVTLAAPVAVVLLAFAVVTLSRSSNPATTVLTVASVGAVVAGFVASRSARDGWAFAGSFAALTLFAAMLFAGPMADEVPAMAASDYALTVLTWVAAPAIPLVVAAQSWVYWTFRARIGSHQT